MCLTVWASGSGIVAGPIPRRGAVAPVVRARALLGFRLVEGAAVVERPAADPRACKDDDVRQDVDPLHPHEPEPWGPQVAAQVPVRAGMVGVGEPAARLEDPDAVPLLAEPQGGDTATEPAADDHDVV